MDIKGAGLIAGAIVLVGGTWLYWTEIRPAQLREECILGDVAEGGGGLDTEVLSRCVDAGGFENLSAAFRNRPENYADTTPVTEDAFATEGNVAGQ